MQTMGNRSAMLSEYYDENWNEKTAGVPWIPYKVGLALTVQLYCLLFVFRIGFEGLFEKESFKLMDYLQW